MPSACSDGCADHSPQGRLRALEQKKWDSYYEALEFLPEDDITRQFNAELVAQISLLLPEGGATLEAGSGAGWQSLALARTGRFATTLLDFSPVALSYAKRVFEREGAAAEFIQAEIETAASQQFDLVFNLGVLEHYTTDEQVSLIRAMAAGSRRYVMVLVPNRECYWYWVWRLGRSSREEWFWGKEVPVSGLRAAFEASGLTFLGHAYLGSKWTESFINELTKTVPALTDLILAVHNTSLVPLPHRAYMIAALGIVQPEPAPPSGWHFAMDTIDHQTGANALAADLADALAGSCKQTSEIRSLREIVRQSQELALVQGDQTRRERDLVLQERRSLITVIDSISVQASELQAERRVLTERLAQAEEHVASVQTLNQSLATAQTHSDCLGREAEAYRQRATSTADCLADKEREIAAERARPGGLEQDCAKLKQQLVTTGLRFDSSLRSTMDRWRSQRAWRVMLAIRKAYALWMRGGLRGKLSSLRVPLDLIANPRVKFSEYDLRLPSLWDHWFDPRDPHGSAGADQCPLQSTAARFDIIVLPVFDYEFRFQRPQQIAAHFAKAGHRVFWVSPSRFLGRNSPRQFESILLRDNLYEIRLHGDELRIYTETLTSGRAEELANALIEMYREIGLCEAAILVQFPFWRQVAQVLSRAVDARIVYDCMDDWRNWTAEPRISDFSLQQERLLAQECDVLTATSAELDGRLQAETGRAVLRLRNGVDVEFFHDHKVGPALQALPQPIVGYYGAIADWVDIALVEELARMRPRYSFVLIGEVHGEDVSGLAGLPNVHMLGEKSYSLIPSYLNAFGACLFPFKQNRLTTAVDPVKVYEYLSLGKPVIATPLPEVRDHGDLVYFAETAVEFASQLDKALAEPSAMKASRITYAESNSWRRRTDCLTAAIGDSYPMVSILAVSYNSREYLSLFLDSIRKNTSYPRYELIIVDNNSTDGSQNVLRQHESRLPLLRSVLVSQNLGFAAGNNLAAKSAQGEVLVLLNVDTVVTRGWLGRLLRPLRQDGKIGMTAPVTNFSGNETRIRSDYRTLSEMECFARDRAASEFQRTMELEMVPLLCAALPRPIWDEIGELDERYGMGMFEDDDYCVRVVNAGYKIVTAEDCFIHHFGSGSFRKMPTDEAVGLFERNRAYFESKWKMTWEMHRSRAGVPPLGELNRVSVAEFLAASDPEPMRGSAPELLRLLPQRTRVGQSINPQPNGPSAIVVECESAPPGTVVRFDGELLQTAYGHSGLLSAIVPEGFNRAARGIPVSLVSDLGESNVLVFLVDE